MSKESFNREELLKAQNTILKRVESRCSKCEVLWPTTTDISSEIYSQHRDAQGLEKFVGSSIVSPGHNGEVIGDIIDNASANWAKMSEEDKKPWLMCSRPEKLRCSKCKNIIYCSKECQSKDWNRHKKYCQNDIQPDQMPDEFLVSPPMYTDDESYCLPFVAATQRDGFNKIGLSIFYSDHLGPDLLKKWSKRYYFPDDKDNYSIIAFNWNCCYTIVTEPIYDESDRNSMHSCDVASYCVGKPDKDIIIKTMIRENLLTNLNKKSSSQASHY